MTGRDFPSPKAAATPRLVVMASRVHAGTVEAGSKDGRSKLDVNAAGTGIHGAESSRTLDSLSPFRGVARLFLSGSQHVEIQYPLKPLSLIFRRNYRV